VRGYIIKEKRERGEGMARGMGGKGEEKMSGEYTFVRREEESGWNSWPLVYY
jgi:hypothetical protein